MTEYLEKQGVLDAINKEWEGCDGLYGAWVIITDILSTIDELPVADVRPVLRGRWVINNGRWCCDKCTCQAQVIRSPFCPNCGAEMKGV